jgi:hypothetical protein
MTAARVPPPEEFSSTTGLIRIDRRLTTEFLDQIKTCGQPRTFESASFHDADQDLLPMRQGELELFHPAIKEQPALLGG